LVPGDEIHVLGDDGSEVTFIVESREQRPKDELPGERIWAAASYPRLTLVTCGGVFDRRDRPLPRQRDRLRRRSDRDRHGARRRGGMAKALARSGIGCHRFRGCNEHSR
jgi:hypothetical protein